MSRSAVRDLSRIGLFSALIAVCAWIALPTQPPVTLQSFAVLLAALVLGKRGGCAATAVYLLLGALGLPVFSGFVGGLGHLLGMNGGFLFGFLPMAFLVGVLTERWGHARGVPWVACTVGMAVLYLCGAVWLAFVGGIPFVSAVVGMLPFMFPDGLKVVLAVLLARRLRCAIFPGREWSA